MSIISYLYSIILEKINVYMDLTNPYLRTNIKNFILKKFDQNEAMSSK